MTFALGFGLSRNEAMLRGFVEHVAPGAPLEPPIVVELQKHDAADGGFTDIELQAQDLHVIVEAKRGWDPPSQEQLQRYESRLARTARSAQRIVILTQNGAEIVVRHRLGPWKPSDPAQLNVIGWSDVVSIARSASREGPRDERSLAAELATYLREVADMRNVESNSVFVVSLGTAPLANWSPALTTIDLVEKKGRYFFLAPERTGRRHRPTTSPSGTTGDCSRSTMSTTTPSPRTCRPTSPRRPARQIGTRTSF
jgi:hypothetical protein